MEKLELIIMELFAVDPRKRYSIRNIAKATGKQYAPVHAAVQRMIKKEALRKQRIGHTDYCSLELKGDASLFCFTETWRAKQFMRKNRAAGLIIEEILEKLKANFYVLVLFGSYAKGKQTEKSDIDLLLIADNNSRAEELERTLTSISRLSKKALHVTPMNFKDFISMASDKETNAVNQVLGNHIIFSGYEEYYKMLGVANVS
ncbi:MAG: nucleotidyltransferase domain-containing protein [Candidatus Aenigmarchaeota archaeon]|nr:nucleotidyltransferase domain-containing protein [Candidatus Aenigmarchaeota archaeon]